ncbi:MAG TPA: zf-HC2 domain-containing protein [Lysobacter sp.]|nr:zf-HC2 domain-containing protein [Lysobacter sp.]
MSGRVLSFVGSEHAETQRLLPWYVKGTLADDELARVLRHLDDCVRCQHDADELREWAAALSFKASAPDPLMQTDALARGLARLRPRLRAQARHAPSRPRSTLAANWRRAPAWLRWAAATQAAVIVLAVGWMASSWLTGGERDDRQSGATYRTLSDAPAQARDSSIHRLVVVFDPQAETSRVQALLQANQARIVDGPSDTGAYVIAVPASRTASVRATLRAAPEVRLVESLDPAQ